MKKSRITSIEDIDKKNRLIEKNHMKEEIAKDINDVFNMITTPKKSVKKRLWIFRIILFLGIIFLIVILINIVLANIWLLKFFINDLLNSMKNFIK